ncbi:unnamed protein product [Urochloa humidicola]
MTWHNLVKANTFMNLMYQRSTYDTTDLSQEVQAYQILRFTRKSETHGQEHAVPRRALPPAIPGRPVPPGALPPRIVVPVPPPTATAPTPSSSAQPGAVPPPPAAPSTSSSAVPSPAASAAQPGAPPLLPAFQRWQIAQMHYSVSPMLLHSFQRAMHLGGHLTNLCLESLFRYQSR